MRTLRLSIVVLMFATVAAGAFAQNAPAMNTGQRRAAGAAGFVVLHRRWVVERTFGWFVCFRRLSKDYERNPRVSEIMVYIAMTHLMLRRLRPT